MSAVAGGAEAQTPTVAVSGHTISLRVRYSETDQMGTFYNSRALEWFECGRTELLRALGLTYAEMEARGLFLPLVEAHVQYLGRARYDDLLHLTTRLRLVGRARVRLDAEIMQAGDGRAVARGYTIHAFTDGGGKPIKPPGWFLEAVGLVGRGQASPPRQGPPERPGASRPV